MERFKNIADWSINILKTYKVTHVGLEDYAKRALGPVFTIGENTGILKYRIQTELNIPIRLIAPTVIKKFAHGKGSGGKEPMYAAWESDTKIDLKGLLQPKRKLDSPTTDIVDAYFIAGFLNSELYTINKV
jgi:Holliday junction resolvasome RuvABC endonuclease subunit